MSRFLPTVRAIKHVFALITIVAIVGSAYFLLIKTPDRSPVVTAYIESSSSIVTETVVEPLPSGAARAAEAMAAGERQELACQSEQAFCVGVVTGLGRVDDQSINQRVWELISDSSSSWSTDLVGVQVDLIETSRLDDLAPNIEVFVESSYDLIVTTGSHASVETMRAAKANPDIEFIGVLQQGDPELANYRTITGQERDAAYAAVTLAAAASESGTVGLILPPTVDPNYGLFASGAAEAQLATEVELIVTHQPTSRSGSAATWAPDIVGNLLAEEADFVMALGLADEAGVLEVIGAIDSDLLCLGYGSDRWLAAEAGRYCLLTSIEVEVEEPLTELITAMVDGNDNLAGTVAGVSSFSEFRQPEARPEGEEVELSVPLDELQSLARDSLG